MFSSVSGFHHRGGDPYETGSDTPIPNFIASVSPLLSRVCSGLKNVRSNPADAGRNRSILIYCSTTALRSQEKPQANHGFAAKKNVFCAAARSRSFHALGRGRRSVSRLLARVAFRLSEKSPKGCTLLATPATDCRCVQTYSARQTCMAFISRAAAARAIKTQTAPRPTKARLVCRKATKFNPSRQMRPGR